ncbi:potassium-transporting ATPase subunit C [Gordonia sp. ABSL1-1]|uniref:potassium-transporting ATPase subunit C n=1 Tax=Gordonia sp. ABSL1-1 TaxID=3053923 RepID=UPI0025724A59|nr:potassium-transporting ATPase subunit C [Gordonia sp. ABSL1-1]MDL9938553.1 potassium-transporting ATPase subunit C [Gordonia sp. ABSL1-1]
MSVRSQASVVTGFLRQCSAALVIFAVLTVILGVVYPAAVWALSRIDPGAAEGSQLHDARGCVVGSSLIGLDPQVRAGAPDPYLHARVSGSADDPMSPGDPAASAASNKGPNDTDLRSWIDARRQLIARREGVPPTAVPADAVTGSASGLDPHISPAYARLQVPRLARTNGLTSAQVEAIIDSHTDGRQLGFLGEERVNVLEVNLALGHGSVACR